MKVDLLAFGAHPDDVELGCSGTIALSIAQGKFVVLIDLTQGELGTRGSVELRKEEEGGGAGAGGRPSSVPSDADLVKAERSQLQLRLALRS